MDLLEQTKQLCQQYGIKPARSRGQNFLVNEAVYDKVVDAADLKPDDIVLEVGPGFGFLTAKLAKRVKKVFAVELDDKLARALRTGLAAQGVGNVSVVNADILKMPFAINHGILTSSRVLGTPQDDNRKSYKIVANLPYNITSHFLRRFLENEDLRPSMMVLMLQKEVAERICAKPGKMSLLAVSVQYYAEPEIIEIVPQQAFWPRPEVDSAIVKINLKPTPPRSMRGTPPQEGTFERGFFQLVKIGFSSRRKMLKNNLAAGYRLPQNEMAEKIASVGFNEKIRAQDLSVEDWLKLSEPLNGTEYTDKH